MRLSYQTKLSPKYCGAVCIDLTPEDLYLPYFPSTGQTSLRLREDDLPGLPEHGIKMTSPIPRLTLPINAQQLWPCSGIDQYLHTSGGQ
jgi:hypothetical protein